jgi:hypothetical protein
MVIQSESEHTLELSRELLDDIELDRLPANKLILKCSRLARLAGSDEVKVWIQHEMEGYNSTGGISIKYMTKTGRWVNYAEKKGWYQPLAQIDGMIETYKSQLAASAVTNVGGEFSIGAINVLARNRASLSKTITTFTGVRSRVLGLLHNFVTSVYYERQFAKLAETTFERYKHDVDGLIAEKAGIVLSKIPAVVARLQDGDDEAISQALMTCRRIIEAFADAVFPPTDDPIEVNGKPVLLDASRYKNRLLAYIGERTTSTARRDKLRQNLTNLYDRVSAGVHSDVTSEEAFSLFLNVYLFLGEVLHLGEPSSAVVEADQVCL